MTKFIIKTLVGKNAWHLVYELNDVDLIFSLYVVYTLRRYHLLSFYSIYALDS